MFAYIVTYTHCYLFSCYYNYAAVNAYPLLIICSVHLILKTHIYSILAVQLTRYRLILNFKPYMILYILFPQIS